MGFPPPAIISITRHGSVEVVDSDVIDGVGDPNSGNTFGYSDDAWSHLLDGELLGSGSYLLEILVMDSRWHAVIAVR